MNGENNVAIPYSALSNNRIEEIKAVVEKKRQKVAIYCRLSQEDRNKKTKEDDSESIKNQKIMLEKYANKQNWEIYGIYSDDDYTGTDRNRPGFNEVIKLAQEKKFDIILCKSQSRFARELEIVEKYINGLFLDWGIRFVSMTENIDTAIEGTTIMRQMTGVMDENYLARLSVNVKTGLKTKRERGEHTGGLALYGYKKDPENKGHLIIDPIAADVVRTVFTLYNQGMGKTAIARELNNRGIPNPTQYKVQSGIAYKTPRNKLGTLWKYPAIADMLQNQMYIGDMVQGKYGSVSYKSHKNKPKPKEQWVIVKGTHEPIIDMDLWNSVQSKINSNFKPFAGGKIGLFAKKCKCKYCGYNLKTSKSHEDRYLRCPTRQVSKDNCIGSFISENVVKRTVLKEINSLIDKYLNVDKLEESIIIEKFRDKKQQIQKEIAECESNLAKKSKAIKVSYMDKVNGIITQEEFIEFNQYFIKEKESIEVLLEEKQKKLLEFNNEQEALKSKRQILEQYINVTELSREMVDNLIDYIVVGQKDPVTKKKTIEIHWKI